MNDGMLSQDEINELLKGVGVDDGEDELEASDETTSTGDMSLRIDDYLTTMEQDALGEIGNISFGSAATALSTLLNQKVDITTPQVSMILQKELVNEFPQPHVAVHVEYTAGFEGTNLLVIRTPDAAIIADLMLGGDGTNPNQELGEMEISAVQEAMNQMMGSASTSMSTIFNKKVDISPPGIDMLDVKNEQGTGNLPKEPALVKVSFRLKIGDLIDSSIMQLLTVEFAKQLVQDLMNPMSEPVEERAVATEQRPATPMEEPVMQQPQQPMMTPPPQMQQPVAQMPYEPRGQQQLGTSFRQPNVNIQPAAFSSFVPPELSESETKNLNMLLDIPLQVTVELGRTKRDIKEILEFSQGSIIELDKLAGEPVDILVNQKLIAKGEVVVIDENFGVRVTDIVTQEERIKNLR